MHPSNRLDWVQRLAPLVLDGEPLDAQLRRRLGVAWVATGLILGLQLVFESLFASFGRWDIGLVIAGLMSPVEVWIWLGYRRVKQAVGEYLSDPRR